MVDWLMDITWFDAMLVTLWAGITVLGAKRGFRGVVWIASLLVLWPIVTAVSAQTAIFALPLSIALGVLAVYIPQFFFKKTNSESLQTTLGGISGITIGFILVSAIALSFPIKRGYPSNTLPINLYQAIAGSWIVKAVGNPIFEGSNTLKRYVIPDQIKARR
ncbi:MAG: hypothetical protein U0Z75_08075 [Deinococcaceae bacterium]